MPNAQLRFDPQAPPAGTRGGTSPVSLSGRGWFSVAAFLLQPSHAKNMLGFPPARARRRVSKAHSPDPRRIPDLPVLALAAVAAYSVSSRRFLYMLYAILYGFAGLTSLALRYIDSTGAMFLYGIGTSPAVILLIFTLSRRYREGA